MSSILNPSSFAAREIEEAPEPERQCALTDSGGAPGWLPSKSSITVREPT